MQREETQMKVSPICSVGVIKDRDRGGDAPLTMVQMMVAPVAATMLVWHRDHSTPLVGLRLNVNY